MKLVRLLPLSALALCFAACQQTPGSNEFVSAYAHMQRQLDQDMAQLKARRDAGQITAEQYAVERQALQDTVASRANDRVLTEHQLRESYNAALGMPKPGSEAQAVNFDPGPVDAYVPSRPGFERFQ